MSHRQELSTNSSYCCCCEPEFDLQSRHDALDSPSTLCIRVPSPLAWGQNNVRELRGQRQHVLGDGGRGSIVTASPLSYRSTIGVPSVDYSGSRTNCCCMNTWYLVGGTWASVSYGKNQGLSWADAGGPARGWAGPGRPARPCPPIFEMMGRDPARPVKFSEDGPRPGPAHHIFKNSRPGPSFFQTSRPGPVRPITWRRGP